MQQHDSTRVLTLEHEDDRVHLEVWSDVACPWCYVGRRNLAIALEDIDPIDRPRVTWRAYQLDPTVPVDGVDADAYFEARFGANLPRIRASQEQLVAIGEELGIDFRFDRQRRVSNTLLAHRALAAAELQDPDLREPLMDTLFAAYFERGVDIGDGDAIRALFAEQLGDAQLAAELVDAAQGDRELAVRVDADIEAAGAIGITGVPCFVADRAIAVPGAVPPPVLAQLIAEAAERRRAADD